MRKQIKGLDKGASNIQEGVSLVQVADGALAEVTGMLQRMNVLSVQAANGTNSQSDRKAIQDEIDQLNKEIDRIGETTSFNGTYIFRDLDGETEGREHEVIDLMSCPSAEEGYLREAYKVGNSYHPAGTINFKNVTGGNLNYVLGAQFTFTCSQSCPEAFEFELVNGQSSATDLSGSVTHKYKIGIGICFSCKRRRFLRGRKLICCKTFSCTVNYYRTYHCFHWNFASGAGNILCCS